jgi:hypothetical protein
VNLKIIELPQDPIFIVGYPRSGTTLLQGLLVTQNGFFSLPETHYFNVVYKVIQTDEEGHIKLDCLDNVFQKIHEKMSLNFKFSKKKYITRLAQRKRLTPRILFEFIVYNYLYNKIGRNPKKHYYWIEKTPNHAYFLDEIYSIYPNAYFLNIIRHPVPAIFSRKMKLPMNKKKPLDFLANLWIRSVEETEVFARKNPGKLHSLKYEELTQNPENELKKIGEFLGVKFDLGLITNHAILSKEFILKTEFWKNTHSEIFNDNSKYLNIIKKPESEEIESMLVDYMKTYNYKPFFHFNNEKL